MEGGFIPEPEPEAERLTSPGNRIPDQRQSPAFQPPSAQQWTQNGSSNRHGSGCSKCTSLSYSDEYFKAFGVFLCNQCRRSEKLISKVSISIFIIWQYVYNLCSHNFHCNLTFNLSLT